MVKEIDGVVMVDVNSIKAAAFDELVKGQKRANRRNVLASIILLAEGIGIGALLTREYYKSVAKKKEESNGTV